MDAHTVNKFMHPSLEPRMRKACARALSSVVTSASILSLQQSYADVAEMRMRMHCAHNHASAATAVLETEN